MNIVAVYDLGKDEEKLSQSLASALGKTVYEVRSRLRVPGGGPSVIALYQETAQAEENAAKLMANGFKTVILQQKEIESNSSRFLARSFEFTAESLLAESRQKHKLTLPYHDVRLILYGSGITVHTETETVNKRTFSMGRAIMTSGLMITKGSKQEIQTHEQSRERFIYIYAQGKPTAVFREHELLYDSLGKAIQVSRSANFTYFTSELRKKCAMAMFDDRLLTRGSQVQILGPLLTPEEHLDIATSLLAKVLKPAS